MGLYHDMDTVDKLNFYTENKEWKVGYTYIGRVAIRYEEGKSLGNPLSLKLLIIKLKARTQSVKQSLQIKADTH